MTRSVGFLRMAGALAIRPATWADASFLLSLRNEPDVVSVSRHDQPVDSATHAAWLSDSLQCPNRKLFVLCLDGAPVGQARLDATPEGEWVSIALTSGARGSGMGTAALQALQAKSAGDLLAEVKETNERSLALFRRSGFEGHAVVDGFVQLRWTKLTSGHTRGSTGTVREDSHED